MTTKDSRGIALAGALFLLASTMAVNAAVLAAENTGARSPATPEGIVFGSLTYSFQKADGTVVSPEDMRTISYIVYFTPRKDDKRRVRNFFVGLLGGRETELASGSTKQGESLFVQRLPAGEYTISKIERDRWGQSAYVLTDMHFTVAPGKSTYIGTLKLKHHGGLRERINTEVLDDSETVIPMFKAENPRVAFEIETRLLTRFIDREMSP